MKVVKKIAWWIASGGLIVAGLSSFLLLKVIEWADPIDECECDDPIHEEEHK